jgi:transcription elongation regulator 1
MTSDPRYDAVGSSSLRAELFQRHLKNLANQAESSNTETPEQAAARKAKERKEKAQASLRDRQQQVQGEKMRLERDLQKSKYGAGKEDGEREFGSLLIQAIREHNVRETTTYLCHERLKANTHHILGGLERRDTTAGERRPMESSRAHAG